MELIGVNRGCLMRKQLEFRNFFEIDAPRRKQRGLWSEDTQMFHGNPSLLTPKRLELLQFIATNPGKSITQLSQQLKRKKEAISRDISLLRQHDLVTVRRRGREKGVEVSAGHIVIPLRR
jgi:predicted transcriptional regulator